MLAFSAALVVPYFVDWSQYTARFEQEASKVLGRRVSVNGDVTARLFPFPSVRFTDVVVASRNADAPPAMWIDAFSMDAELAPFLSGEILIFDMRVEGALARAAIGADGSIDWAIRPDTPFDPSQIKLENITITGAELQLMETGRQRVHAFTDLDLTVRADTLQGPWRVAGSGVFDGLPAEIAVSTGRVRDDGQMRLRATVRPDALPLRMESDGLVRLVNRAPRYEGSVAILSETRGEAGDDAPDDGELARLNGQFKADHTRIAIDEFRFETGPSERAYAATGSVTVDLGDRPGFVVEARGDQVRVEAPGSGAQTGTREAISLADRFKTVSQVLASTPQLTIPGVVNLDLPAIVAGSTTIRSVKVSARPNGNLWEITSASAEFPGRTIVEASGRLITGVQTSFEGKAVVASRQLSGLAAWLGSDVSERIRRLGAAGASADVYLADTVQSFRNLELIAGDTKLIGLMERQSPANAKPTIAMRLSGETMNADALQALAALMGGEGEGVAVARSHNIDVSLKAGTLSAGPVTLREVNTSVRLRGDRLEVDRFSVGDAAGTALSATATITDPFGVPTGNADVSLISEDLQGFIGLAARQGWAPAISGYLSARGRAYPGLFEDAQIDSVISLVGGARSRSLTGSMSGVAGGSAVVATVTRTDQPDGAPINDISISLTNPNAAPVMALGGIDALPFDLGRPLGVDLTVGGRLSDGLSLTAALESGESEGAIEAVVREADGGALSAEGRVSAGSDDIEDFLVLAGVSFPGLGLGLPVDLASAFSGTLDDFTLAGIEGSLAGADIEGSLSVTQVDDPTSPALGLRMVTGDVTASEADLILLGEAVVGATALTGDDTALFDTQTQMPFAASIGMDIGAAGIGRFGVIGDAKFTLEVARDGFELRDLSGVYRDALLNGSVSIKNNAGAGLVSASGSWKGVDLAGLISGRRGAAPPVAGRANIAGNISATGRSLEGLVAGLAGSGSITARDVVFAGLNIDALQPVLTAADPLGVELDEETARAITLEALASGPFAMDNLPSAFTIAGGVVRLPPLIVDKDAARLRFDARRDFNSGTVEAGGEIEYKPHAEDVLSGAQPRIGFAVEGPADNPRIRFDTAPMVQYLTQRALEREQVRVQIMQAVLLEKQQMRRELRLVAAVAARRERDREIDRIADIEAQRLADELARLAEEEARREAEEEARRAQEAEEARQAAALQAEQTEQRRLKRQSEQEAARQGSEASGDDAITQDQAPQRLKFVLPGINDPAADSF